MKNADKLAEQRLQNKETASAYAKAYYAANSEKLKTKSAERLAANREKINALERDRYKPEQHWRKKNPDRNKEVVSAYLKENAHKRIVYEANRRARKASGGDLSPDSKERLMKLQRGRCACCGDHLKQDCHLDHVHPLSKGGQNTFSNVQLLCKPCNLAKNAKHPIDFMQSRGYLL